MQGLWYYAFIALNCSDQGDSGRASNTGPEYRNVVQITLTLTTLPRSRVVRQFRPVAPVATSPQAAVTAGAWAR